MSDRGTGTRRRWWPVELLLDAATGLLARPGRALLTMSGILLGLASIVVTAGLAASAAANVVATFDQYAATAVTLRTRGESLAEVPDDASRRLGAIPGVTGVGVFCSLPGPPVAAGARGRAAAPSGLAVTGVSPGGLEVLRPHVAAGRDVTAAEALSGSKVAVLGRGAAAALGIAPPQAGGALRIDDLDFAAGGVIDTVKRRPAALVEVFVPMKTARTLWPQPCTTWEIILETQPGAAPAVGRSAALTATPNAPDVWTVVVPPAPDELKGQVSTDLSSLYLALAGMSVAIGVLSIANTMSIAVLERTGEIGLRRALGFSRRDVIGLFGIEATFLGGLGGLLGAGVGAIAVIAICLTRGWPIVIPAPILLGCLPAGAIIGFLGGLVPALRAGRLEPATALRS